MVAQKRHVQISRNFLYMLSVAVARSSSDDNTVRYVFPVLWMRSWLYGAWLRRRIVKVAHHGEEPVVKSWRLLPSLTMCPLTG